VSALDWFYTALVITGVILAVLGGLGVFQRAQRGEHAAPTHHGHQYADADPELPGEELPTAILTLHADLTEQALAGLREAFDAAVAETPIPREPWLPAPLPVTTEPPLAPLPSTGPGLPRACPDVTATENACDTVVGMKAIPGRTVLKEHVAKTMRHTRSALGSWVDEVLASDVPLVDQELGLMAARNERWAEAQHG
jgi:hypothetical protein